MYGKSSKKRCFLTKNGNTFITIQQLCIWYLLLYILANFFGRGSWDQISGQRFHKIWSLNWLGRRKIYNTRLLYRIWYLNFRCLAAHLKFSAEDLGIRPSIWAWISRLVCKSSSFVLGSDIWFQEPGPWIWGLVYKSRLKPSPGHQHPRPRVSDVTAQKMKFSTEDFFSKCDQIRWKQRKQRIWSHSLKKSLMENFIFCAVCGTRHYVIISHGKKPTYLIFWFEKQASTMKIRLISTFHFTLLSWKLNSR